KLSGLPAEKKAGRRYELPTEAEWEHACRAGTTGPFAFGAALSTDQANCDGTYPYNGSKRGLYRRKPTTAGRFPQNAFGLCDMHGNVWEWCSDWYGPYAEDEKTDPKGPEKGTARILRGGSWFSYPWRCRSAYRRWSAPGFRDEVIGCRMCLRGG